jgi:hypothetical protein
MNKNESFVLSQKLNASQLANISIDLSNLEESKESVKELMKVALRKVVSEKNYRYSNDTYKTLNSSFECLALFILPFRIDTVRNYVKGLNVIETEKEYNLKEVLEYNNIDPSLWLTKDSTVKQALNVVFASIEATLKTPKVGSMGKKEIGELYKKEYFKYMPIFPIEVHYKKGNKEYSTFYYSQDKEVQDLYSKDFIKFLEYLGYDLSKIISKDSGEIFGENLLYFLLDENTIENDTENTIENDTENAIENDTENAED